MTTTRSSAVRPKATGHATPKAPKPGKAAARKPAVRAVVRGRNKVAEMLRELQIDGKARSLEIERLSHRFL